LVINFALQNGSKVSYVAKCCRRESF